MFVDDLTEILSADQTVDCSAEFYSTYCSLIVNIFYHYTRNLRELKYLANMNYQKYREPVTNQAGGIYPTLQDGNAGNAESNVAAWPGTCKFIG